MKSMTLSVSRTVASHYHRDSRDYLQRFDIVREVQLHKTGRIKSFIDLLVACECELKTHVFLGREAQDAKIVYRTVRKLGHDIGRLASYASYLKDRRLYGFVADRLGPASIALRYSLDFYETFFPSAADAEIDYSRTFGNHKWLSDVRASVGELIESSNAEFEGIGEKDVKKLLEHELAMKAFVDECMR